MDFASLEEKMLVFFQQLEKKRDNLEKSFSKAKNSNSFAPFWRIRKTYQQIVQETQAYQLLAKEKTTQENLAILEQEIKSLQVKKKQLLEKFQQELISSKDFKENLLMEIRPGTGGTEAGLFAGDLYRMYYKFAYKKGWKLELTEAQVDGLGNFTFIAFLVKGQQAYQYLKNEAGVHRVQRVPVTESKGRLQTSTASVVVLPEIQDIAVNICPQNLKIETYRSSGAGGQHVNVTDSAVRITHQPTGITATSQDGRSQHDNKEKALFILKSRLFEKYQQAQKKTLGNLRSLAIGSSERAEKIRTYNYSQNRVTDHRCQESWNKLNAILTGELEEICQKLIAWEVEKTLADYENILGSRT